VTVFRYPATPQVNYIKRLIGLENETIMLRNGQVFVQKEGSDHFEIQRKPLRALLAMLRPVDDNDYVIPAIHELGWKTRWYGDEHWQRSADYKSFTGTSSADEFSWLKFRYITATTLDWLQLIQGRLPEEGNQTGTPQLITDSVAYNTELVQYPLGPRWDVFKIQTPQSGEVQMCRRLPEGLGYNWVGDLAVRCTLNVEGTEGFVALRLVKGGSYFQCDLDIASGKAVFWIPEVPEFEPFSVKVPIRIGHNHDVMFCNVDEEMRLIVDGKEIDTQGKGRYDALCHDDGLLSRDRSPTVLDLEPAAIGLGGNTSVHIEHLKIMRNLYYISSDDPMTNNLCDLIDSPFRYGFSFDHEESAKKILSMPEYWTNFGKTRRTVFKLEKDQFLMCGDNSAQSKDSRLWTSDGIPYYVERQYLIGEAIFVFWPHGLRIPGTKIALIPNFPKMRWID
jgi:signal peptidase I